MITLPGNKLAVTPLFDPLRYGKIIIPEQARERCDQGIVKYLGKDCEFVRVGDHVLFSGYTGTLLQLEGEGLVIILPEEYVVATIGYDGNEVTNTDIPGLYFRSQDGTYFTATYEQAMNLITRGLEEAQWYIDMKQGSLRLHKEVVQRPPLKDYER